MNKVLLLLLLSAVNLSAQSRFVKEVNNISDLLKATPFDINQSYLTRGYYSPNDGGGGFFIITNTVSFTNTGTRIKIPGQNYSAERIHTGSINPRWFGCLGNGFTDDTANFLLACNYASSNNYSIYIPSRSNFVVDDSIISVVCPFNGEGPSSKITVLGILPLLNISSGAWLSKVTVVSLPSSIELYFQATTSGLYLTESISSNLYPNIFINRIGSGASSVASSVVTDSLSNYIHTFYGGIRTIPFVMTNTVIDGHAGKVQYTTLTNNEIYTFSNFDTGVDVLLVVSNTGPFTATFTGADFSGGAPVLSTNFLNFIEFLEYNTTIVGLTTSSSGTNGGFSFQEVYSGNYGGSLPVDVPVGSALNYDLDSPGVLYFWNGVTWY